MWVFITLLCLIGVLLTLIRISLCERKAGAPGVLVALVDPGVLWDTWNRFVAERLFGMGPLP